MQCARISRHFRKSLLLIASAIGCGCASSQLPRLPEDRPVSFSTVTVTDGDDPHAYGFDIGLCYAAGVLSGVLSEYGGSIADPSSAVLENIRYDNTTGDVKFEANIKAGKSRSSTSKEWVTVMKHVSVSGRINRAEFRGTIAEAETKGGKTKVWEEVASKMKPLPEEVSCARWLRARQTIYN
jgi:hypothetical protein